MLFVGTISRLPAAILVCVILALGLAVFLPAPGWAADDPAVRVRESSLPPPGAAPLPVRPAKRPTTLSVTSDTDRETGTGKTAGGIMLSPEEYRQFKRLVSLQTATPLQVGLVTLAARGPALLVIFIAWLICLLLMRCAFNYWWDEDVFKKTWPSTAVICVMLACTAYLLRAALL